MENLIVCLQCTSTETATLYKSHPGLLHSGDAGVDLYVPKDITIPANARGFAIDHEVACAMTVDNEYYETKYRSYYLYPRSSISKTPLRMCNSLGVIDSGYRGHIIAMVDNVTNTDYKIAAGTRLFQLCGPTLQPLKLELVQKLNETTRGSGGFGSTGK